MLVTRERHKTGSLSESDIHGSVTGVSWVCEKPFFNQGDLFTGAKKNCPDPIGDHSVPKHGSAGSKDEKQQKKTVLTQT